MKMKLNYKMFILLYLLILFYYVLQALFMGGFGKSVNIPIFLLAAPIGTFIAASIIILIIYISQIAVKSAEQKQEFSIKTGTDKPKVNGLFKIFGFLTRKK